MTPSPRKLRRRATVAAPALAATTALVALVATERPTAAVRPPLVAGVEVPDVRGCPLDVAATLLTQLRLRLRASGEGTVVANVEEPRVGDVVPAGAIVLLLLGSPEVSDCAYAVVPAVVGRTLAFTRGVVSAARLQLDGAAMTGDATVGTQDPPPGTVVLAGTTVVVLPTAASADSTAPTTGAATTAPPRITRPPADTTTGTTRSAPRTVSPTTRTSVRPTTSSGATTSQPAVAVPSATTATSAPPATTAAAPTTAATTIAATTTAVPGEHSPAATPSSRSPAPHRTLPVGKVLAALVVVAVALIGSLRSRRARRRALARPRVAARIGAGGHDVDVRGGSLALVASMDRRPSHTTVERTDQ